MSGYAEDPRNPGQTTAGDAMTGAGTGATRDATSGVTPGETPTAMSGAMSGATTEAHEYTATTDHDVIRRWAEDRHATPATVGGEDGDGIVGELRLDFDFGNDLEDLRAVTWDEWFAAFDERGDQFVYQETTRPDGSRSNDFHLEERGAR
ncbi:hypothetical protein ACI3KY_05160 [Microbacterium sp. ZW T2_14]|uniref:hypothetical protein n=1 Tax=Microbacterium sp. ZW T2_14 TaxID=3378079 RepID=UPI003851E8E6